MPVPRATRPAAASGRPGSTPAATTPPDALVDLLGAFNGARATTSTQAARGIEPGAVAFVPRRRGWGNSQRAPHGHIVGAGLGPLLPRRRRRGYDGRGPGPTAAEAEGWVRECRP